MTGKIRFTLEFDGDENIASVTVKQATDIPAADASGFSDPFVKVSLVPAGKKQYKTKVWLLLVVCYILFLSEL